MTGTDIQDRTAVPGATISRARDAFDHGRHLNGWRLECTQLTPGRFESVTQEIRLNHFQIIRESTNQALIKRGASWPESLVVSLPLSASGRGWLSGRELPAGAALMSDGSELLELRTPTRLDLVCLAFDRRWFAVAALEAGHPALAEQIWRQERFSLPERHWEGLGRLFLSMFAEMERRPALLSHAASRASLEAEILESLFDALARSDPMSLEGETPRKQLADRVRHMALRDPSEAPNLAAICRQLCISRAHLQKCFSLSYGLTATQMLRALRLHGARHDLRTADDSASIGDIAARWGFWHWSRFTADYRRHFGELPSITRNAAQKTAPRTAGRQFRRGRSDFG